MSEDQSEIHLLHNRIKELEMNLEEKNKRIAFLESRIQTADINAASAFENRENETWLTFIKDFITIYIQANLHSYLAQASAKLVEAEDLLQVEKQVIAVLEKHGFSSVGTIGEIVEFSPEIHAPIHQGIVAREGDHVKIRLTGVRYNNLILRKAAVIKSKD